MRQGEADNRQKEPKFIPIALPSMVVAGTSIEFPDAQWIESMEKVRHEFFLLKMQI